MLGEPGEPVTRMWPAADLTPFAAFAWEPRGGYGDAYQTAQAFAGAARRAGARLHQGTTVTSIRTTGDQVTGVELADGGTIATNHVVLTAGPWSVGLLAPQGIELPIIVHREQIVLIDPGGAVGPVPVFSNLVWLQYIRPEGAGTLLVGNSDLSQLEAADPDDYSDRADSAHIERTVDRGGTRLPGLPAPAIASTHAGCYDVTPDFNPVISQAPVSGLVVAAGFSSHRFKISPAVGCLVVGLVIDGKSSDTDIPAKDFAVVDVLGMHAAGALVGHRGVQGGDVVLGDPDDVAGLVEPDVGSEDLLGVLEQVQAPRRHRREGGDPVMAAHHAGGLAGADGVAFEDDDVGDAAPGQCPGGDAAFESTADDDDLGGGRVLRAHAGLLGRKRCVGISGPGRHERRRS
jgi:hypothetical protein